ncbi:MAG TPA: AI-2E family transporter [Vicinamibacterales bacterium]|nr:AI-2E family transporter [Vicinamibacterales bacterium]
MAQARERHLILFAVAALLGGGVLLWTLIEIKSVLLVIYVSGLLAMGFSPAIRRFERDYRQLTKRTLPRWVSILLLYLLLGLAVVLIFAIVLPPFLRQVRALWQELPHYFDMAQDALQRAGVLSERWTSADVIAQLPNPGAAVAQVAGALKGVFGVVGMIVTVLILPAYLLLEADALAANFIKLFPRDRRTQVSRIMTNVTAKVGAWLSGQLLLSAIIGTSAAIGLMALGVPYFYVFAVLSAVGEMVPVIGPVVSSIPAVLVGFSVSIHTGVFVAIYFIVQQFLENHFIVPRVMQQQVGVSAVTVIVALLIGTELLGFAGALLAVPSAAIVQVLVKEYLERE